MDAFGMHIKAASILFGQRTMLIFGRNFKLLTAMGWRVVTIWECELKKSTAHQTLTRLEEQLRDINTKLEK